MTRADELWLYQWVDDADPFPATHWIDDLRDVCGYPVPDPAAPRLSSWGRAEFPRAVCNYLRDLQEMARDEPWEFARKLWGDVNAWSTEHDGALPEDVSMHDVERLTRILMAEPSRQTA